MADILDYLDAVHIDVVKRKYYNANKVNAVFEELRSMAGALLEENESLREALAERDRQQQSSAEALNELQALYRETLGKAHERADAIVSEAEASSSEIRSKAEERAEQAARQLERCVSAIRTREEQNIEFLNTRMQAFLSRLNGAEERKPPEHKDSDLASYPGSNIGFPENAVSGKDDLPDDLVSKINQLSQEIQALETES